MDMVNGYLYKKILSSYYYWKNNDVMYLSIINDNYVTTDTTDISALKTFLWFFNRNTSYKNNASIGDKINNICDDYISLKENLNEDINLVMKELDKDLSEIYSQFLLYYNNLLLKGV